MNAEKNIELLKQIKKNINKRITDLRYYQECEDKQYFLIESETKESAAYKIEKIKEILDESPEKAAKKYKEMIEESKRHETKIIHLNRINEDKEYGQNTN